MSVKNQVTCATVASGVGRGRATRLLRGVFATPTRSLATLAIAASVAGVWFQAAAAPPADQIFSACTFKIADLRKALSIDATQFEGNVVQASYILIYVRQNRNDGQKIKGTQTYTGPILCVINSDQKTPTTESTAIGPPNGPEVDILETEEAFHLRYQQPSGPSGDFKKRVCHTVGTNTNCFIIGPKP